MRFIYNDIMFYYNDAVELLLLCTVSRLLPCDIFRGDIFITRRIIYNFTTILLTITLLIARPSKCHIIHRDDSMTYTTL